MGVLVDSDFFFVAGGRFVIDAEFERHANFVFIAIALEVADMWVDEEVVLFREFAH